MRKKLLVAILAAASLAALVAAASSRPQGFAVPAGLEVRAKEEAPLLGIRWSALEQRNELVRVDPATLRASPEPALGLGKLWTAWDYSPDGERLAIARHAATRRGTAVSLQILDPRTFRRELALPLGYGEVHALAWVEPDRVLALQRGYHPSRLEVVVAAPSARRVLTRVALQGDVMEAQATRDSLVVLLSPPGRIGAATLAVASSNGEVRTVTLERVWIGMETPDAYADQPIFRRRSAGFTVDPDGGRALLFPAGSDAAEVDLKTLAVSYHTLAEPVSFLERAQRLLDPAANAKSVDGPSRSARWLGGGLVAVTGVDNVTWKDRESRLQSRTTPAGLTLVDTRTWRTRTIDRGATLAAHADGVLVATGASCDTSTRQCSSMGVAAYGLDGSRRFWMLEGRDVGVKQVFRGLAYVFEHGERVRVVELASGRIVGTRPDEPPWLLLDGASMFGG